MINLIWAMTYDGVIGKQGRLPWHIKEDLCYFKAKTEGKTVLMGENTYYSLKSYYQNKPLPYAKTYVASLTKDLILADASVIADAKEFLKNFNGELWVVGGASIYEVALPYADNLFISFIKKYYTGDTYFPNFDLSLFKLNWKKETTLVSYTIFERV